MLKDKGILKLKNLFLIFIILWYTRFFSCVYFPFTTLYGAISHIFEFFIFMIVIVNRKRISPKMIFAKYMVLLMITPFFSIFTSVFILDQPLFRYVVRLSVFYLFLLYYLLDIYRFTKKDILSVLLCLGFAYCFIRVIEQFTYPSLLFVQQERFDELTGELEQRNNLWRILLLGFEFSVFALYFKFNKFLEKGTLGRILLVILGCASLYLGLGRVSYVQCIMAIFLMYIKNLRCWKTWFRIGIVVVIVCLVIANLDLLLGDRFYQQTTSEISSDDYIRNLSYAYYINESIKSVCFFLFGHGLPVEGSRYTSFILNMEDNYHFYRSDVGLIGQFYMYGFFNIIVTFLFLFKAIRLSVNVRYIFAYLTPVVLFYFIIPVMYFPYQIVFYAMITYLLELELRPNEKVL